MKLPHTSLRPGELTLNNNNDSMKNVTPISLLWLAEY